MKYNFYYDESEHSRVINLSTIKGKTYYDNFFTAIVGWSSDKEKEVEKKYILFEEKYADRKKKNELKSETFKAKQFKFGFASLNRLNVEMMNDFFSIFDDNFYIYLCVASKIEFIILQLFKNYHNNFIVDMDAIKYSIIKTILVYRPEDVINNIYNTPGMFVESLINFFSKRLEINKKNLKLKEKENEAFENILLILQDVEPPVSIDWDYHISFLGFDYFLKNKAIDDYTLILDKEGMIGENSKTLVAAKEVGLRNCRELDSKERFGIRMADMLAGIVGKLMKSISCSLHNEESNVNVTKNLLNKEWFCINDNQLQLYKKLYHIIFEINNDWYKIYSGNYSDDLISFLGLLEYMNHFKTTEDMKKDFEMHPEYCNTCMCNRLQDHFEQMHNKLSIEPLNIENTEYFRNNQGEKVYYDIERQPILELSEGKNIFFVLSVGILKSGLPLITIKWKSKNICYRLPTQLSDWAMTIVAMANMGENLFPSEVVFTKINNHYFADIL